jgi:hypothetical protein
VSARRRRTAVVGLGCLCMTGLGFLSGMVVERVRFDVRRNAVLTKLSEAGQQLHGRLMDLERLTTPPERDR